MHSVDTAFVEGALLVIAIELGVIMGTLLWMAARLALDGSPT